MFLSPSHTGAGIAAVLGNTGRLLVVVLAAIFLGEPLTRAKLTSLALGLIGVGLIAYPTMTDLSRRGVLGAILPLVAAAGTAVQSIIVKRLEIRTVLLQVTACQFILGGLALLLASDMFEPSAVVVRCGTFVALFLFLTIVGTSDATARWFWLVQDADVGHLTLQLFLVPVFGLFLAMALFRERIGMLQGAGIITVVVGIILIARESSRAPRAPEPARRGSGDLRRWNLDHHGIPHPSMASSCRSSTNWPAAQRSTVRSTAVQSACHGRPATPRRTISSSREMTCTMPWSVRSFGRGNASAWRRTSMRQMKSARGSAKRWRSGLEPECRSACWWMPPAPSSRSRIRLGPTCANAASSYAAFTAGAGGDHSASTAAIIANSSRSTGVRHISVASIFTAKARAPSSANGGGGPPTSASSARHAKTLVVDDSVATVGTANLDYRSLFVNYELNLFSANAALSAALSRQFAQDLVHSVEVTPERWVHRRWMAPIAESVGRLAR